MLEARAPEIATPEEVLETYTALLRGEKAAEQMKAADALAKYHGLFAVKEDAAPLKQEAVDTVERTLAALTREEPAGVGEGG